MGDPGAEAAWSRDAAARPAKRAARRGRLAAALAVAAGWGLALATLAPAALAPAALASGPRAEPAGSLAPWLVLAGVLAWWVAVVATVRSDLGAFVIPDEATAATAVLGLAVAFGAPLLAGGGGAVATDAALQALVTGAVCFAVFWLVGTAFRSLGRDALGFGDVKLAGAAGLWLPPGDAALALEIAALGAIAALLVFRRGGALRETAVPFGAFLAPAAWLVFVLAPLLRGGAAS